MKANESKALLRELRGMKSVHSTSMVSMVLPPNTNL